MSFLTDVKYKELDMRATEKQRMVLGLGPEVSPEEKAAKRDFVLNGSPPLQIVVQDAGFTSEEEDAARLENEEFDLMKQLETVHDNSGLTLLEVEANT